MLPGIERAVLTGDVVASKELPAETQAELANLVTSVWQRARDHWGRQVLPAPPDVFRGDSWQFVVRSPAHALHLALYVRCRLRLPETSPQALLTRASIGLGEITVQPAGPNRPGVGTAFVTSGAALDEMPDNRWLTIGVGDSAPASLAPALRAIAALTDHVAAGWTDNQARAVAGRIAGLKQREIAQDWGGRTASQQSVAQALAGAGWDAVDESLQGFAEIFR